MVAVIVREILPEVIHEIVMGKGGVRGCGLGAIALDDDLY